MKRLIGCWLAAVLLLTGCAGVTVSSVSPAQYLTERRGDVLTTGRISEHAQEVLRVLGIADCSKRPVVCRETLVTAQGLSEEQRLSALSELWLEAALAADRAPTEDGQDDAALDAWLETARHAYAYLFFTARRPGARAFEDRQTQVRDYYNYAVQQTVTRLFKVYRSTPEASHTTSAVVGSWRITSQADDFQQPGHTLANEREAPLDELLAASSLRFTGLRNTYRRDGFGAALVAVIPRPVPAPSATAPTAPTADAANAVMPDGAQPFEESRFPAVTALLRFAGETLPEVLATRDVRLMLYDPYHSTQTQLGDETVPLAANFTAGYGLWLARSGFAMQSLRTLFGTSDGIVRPHVVLMQPYDSKRRTVVMLHGLASSPEAWINVANEVMGDETLRRNYQIWQVYYPSNAPLALNLRTIREALDQTLAYVDPAGTAPASQEIVLVGHSMGGVLARLLVSSSGEDLWAMLPQLPPAASPAAQKWREQMRKRLTPYLEFEPMPQVTRAIFIAAPHRGTPFAGNPLARGVANLVTLPLAMLDRIGDVTGLFALPGLEDADAGPLRIPNSIDNLRDTDPFVRAASVLPISPRVRYHSIIGQDDMTLPMTAADDGIVPYASAHLSGAVSERVLPSGHSVQEHPLAILEIRRILRESLPPQPGH